MCEPFAIDSPGARLCRRGGGEGSAEPFAGRGRERVHTTSLPCGYDSMAASSEGLSATSYAGPVRMTDFWDRMEQQFGAAYARSLADDYRLPSIGMTANAALAAAVPTKEIWRAVCAEFDVAAALR